MHIFHYILITLAIFFPVHLAQACDVDHNHHKSVDHNHHKSKIIAENAWIRSTIGNNKNTAAYVTLTNTSDQDRHLRGASWGAENGLGGVIHLHESKKVDGNWTMQNLHHGIVIPAGETVRLVPRSLHIMLMNLNGKIKKSQQYQLILHWHHAPDQAVIFEAR